MSINKCFLSGNLTRDCELRRTQSGMAVASFGMAVNDRRKNQQTGEWDDYPNYIDCTMFGNRAESISGYLTKGLKVSVEGKLRWSQWERDGNRRSKLEVVVDEIEFMSQLQNGGSGYQNGAQGGYQPQAGGYSPNGYGAPQNAPQQPQGGYQPTQQGGYYAPPTQQQAQQGQPSQPQQQVELDSSIYDADIPFGG